MSMARINKVKAARKPANCEKCGQPIVKGAPYIWYTVGFRSQYIHKRHDRAECYPRDSERESSRMSEAMSALEGARDDIEAARNGEPGEPDAFSSAIQTASEQVREVADAYREADEAIGGGGYTDSGERADTLEQAADELDWSPDADEPEACEEHEANEPEGCEECAELRRTWWSDTADSALEVLDNVSL